MSSLQIKATTPAPAPAPAKPSKLQALLAAGENPKPAPAPVAAAAAPKPLPTPTPSVAAAAAQRKELPPLPSPPKPVVAAKPPAVPAAPLGGSVRRSKDGRIAYNIKELMKMRDLPASVRRPEGFPDLFVTPGGARAARGGGGGGGGGGGQRGGGGGERKDPVGTFSRLPTSENSISDRRLNAHLLCNSSLLLFLQEEGGVGRGGNRPHSPSRGRARVSGTGARPSPGLPPAAVSPAAGGTGGGMEAAGGGTPTTRPFTTAPSSPSPRRRTGGSLWRIRPPWSSSTRLSSLFSTR